MSDLTKRVIEMIEAEIPKDSCPESPFHGVGYKEHTSGQECSVDRVRNLAYDILEHFGVEDGGGCPLCMG